MLYITRTGDTYPAACPLVRDRDPQGNRFLPYRLETLSGEKLDRMQNFSQAAAMIWNLFFGTRLTGADVDFLIGRKSFRLRPVSHRMIVGELWHNSELSSDAAVRQLTRKSLGNPQAEATEWGRTAFRIGALFGIFAELRRTGAWDGGEPLDLAVGADRPEDPLAAFYAGELGLPAGTLVLGCSTDSTPWDLFCQGEVRGRRNSPRDPGWLEEVIRRRLGNSQAEAYRKVCLSGGVYAPSVPEQLQAGFSAAVIGRKRLADLIPNAYATSGCLFSSQSALGYGALQDFRALNPETHSALILSAVSPAEESEAVSRCLGISPEELIRRVRND